MSEEPVDGDLEELIRRIQSERALDFRGYKRSSLSRRVQKRMADVNIKSYADYMGYLEAQPDEYTELLNTILINVTSFFRDREAWTALRKKVLPAILKARPRPEQIRVWSAGCASGEEAYTIAILLAEETRPSFFRGRVKIYATDLDEEALVEARRAVYSKKAVQSVPRALLKKYFEPCPGGYIVCRDIRNSVIFGKHNLVDDAPISNVHILICRNVLIYLDSETQDSVLPRLHYGLNDGGYLFLGKSETMLARSSAFKDVDQRHRIFAKVPGSHKNGQIGGRTVQAHRLAQTDSVLGLNTLKAAVGALPFSTVVLGADSRVLLANRIARRTFGVGDDDIGRSFQDLTLSINPVDLRRPVADAIRENRVTRLEEKEWQTTGPKAAWFDIEIAPLHDEVGRHTATLISYFDITDKKIIEQQYLVASEELETTNEELQSSNEELETTNEELQSTNEELETMNEELQSANEELETMNEELQSTNDELRARGQELDLYKVYIEAVLRSVHVGVIVVDGRFNVTYWNRWNENAWGLRSEEVMDHNLFELDMGLQFTPIKSKLRKVLTKASETLTERFEAVNRRGRKVEVRVVASRLMPEATENQGLIMVLEITDGAR